MTLLLFCHGVLYDQSVTAWWWLLPAAAVAAGFTISLAGLIREMRGRWR
jgi:hypothetical protein